MWLLAVGILAGFTTQAQVLTLKEALQTAVLNYPSVKAKQAYAQASKAQVKAVQAEALPNFLFSAQQDYGTVNGQTGPLNGFGGLGTASSGPVTADQNWNAAFGALYLTNINWDIFAFGRARERTRGARAASLRDSTDEAQERFKQQIRVAGSYFTLLGAHFITRAQLRNLERSQTFLTVVLNRARNGLIAGVDSSLANAAVASAKIEYIRAMEHEQEESNKLAVLMGIPAAPLILDTVFISRLPKAIAGIIPDSSASEHPVLSYYKNRVRVSQQQEKYLGTLRYPVFSFFGVLQSRGSGFSSAYNGGNSNFSTNYFDGITPVRTNYLLGLGVTWNLASLFRIKQQLRSQQFISQGLQQEYELANQQITAQLKLSDDKIRYALDSYRQVPLQIIAATDGYRQKTVLYKLGLTTLVEVTQAQYSLNRAETDRDIIYTNVWQALLLKAAASGKINLLTNEF